MTKDINILLVEDSVDDAELLILELEKSGKIVTWERVCDKDSLEKALKTRPRDIVISDYSMPGFTGLEALKIVREFDPILPFILVSGAIAEKSAVDLMKHGAQDYILKSNLIRLSTAVSRVLLEAKIKNDALRDAKDLKESNKRLLAIFNGTTEGMILLKVLKDKFIIDSLNNTITNEIEKFFGLVDVLSFIGLNYKDFLINKVNVSLKQTNLLLNRFRKVANSHESDHFIEKFVVGAHTVYEEIQLNPLIDNGVCVYILAVSKDVTDNINAEENLKQAYNEVRKLKTQLEKENKLLKEEILLTQNFDEIIYKSDAIHEVIRQISQVAPVDASVLITGETGTGKELVVSAIHKSSSRHNEKLIKINCAALPSELIESELFGHEKGAFTGAVTSKLGRFELADKGTIFLDEIGELPIELQPKLLRVLQEGEFDRLGDTKTIKTNVRVIAATNKDLQKEIHEGRFRADLYYRLNVFPIDVPPLRERKDDISVLLAYFVEKYSKKFKKSNMKTSEDSLKALENYDWPGNVRELENIVERALIISRDGVLPFKQLLSSSNNLNSINSMNVLALDKVESVHILKVLENSKWKINGRNGAAEKLGLTPSTLRDRMKKHSISRPE